MRMVRLIRSSSEFRNLIDELKIERIKKGIDKRVKSTERLTKAIANAVKISPEFKRLLMEARIDGK